MKGASGNASDTTSPGTAEDAAQAALFDIEPLWCLDTNVVVSFLREDDNEPYSRQVMPEQWRAFEIDISSGLIIAPPQIRDELEGWSVQISDMHAWLAKHRAMFHEIDDTALGWAKQIVNDYPAYARDRNYLGDLCVIAMAASKGLTVISNEKGAGAQSSPRRPKIPDVCAALNVGCVSVIGYLRRRTNPRVT